MYSSHVSRIREELSVTNSHASQIPCDLMSGDMSLNSGSRICTIMSTLFLRFLELQL